MNKAQLIGHLTRDPEIKYTQSGKAVGSFTVAVNRGFDKDAGTDFIPCVVWEKRAETAGKYLTKGSHVYVEGRIQVRDYEKDGQKKYVTEVVVSEMEFLSQKAQGAHSGAQNNGGTNYTSEPFKGQQVKAEDDIPF